MTYYITSLNRFQKRYTSIRTTKPNLRTYTFEKTHLNLLKNKPALSEENLRYTQFRIPKASGGFRTINAPTELLKTRQRDIVNYLKFNCNLLESPWAYAYIKNTSTLDALRQHQRNQSKWFLKVDIKDFFPSCTPELINQSLRSIFPICSWSTTEQDQLLEIINNYCFLDNGLPQGAVSSPLLSNLALIPFDYQIFTLLKTAENFKKQKYVYTRYADDIIISAKTPFDWKTIQNEIQNILNPYFKLNKDKTRYGSSSGRNWNLGCMLNKDNNITLGYRAKEAWKRTMMNIIIRHNNNEPISLEEKQHLQGMLAYYKNIEPAYFEYLNRHYLEKYHTNFEEIIKTKYEL